MFGYGLCMDFGVVWGPKVGITHGNYRKTFSNKYNVIIEPYNALTQAPSHSYTYAIRNFVIIFGKLLITKCAAYANIASR